jgi:hypothetical protein
MHDDDSDGEACDLDAFLESPSLTEGQKRRLRLFRSVERGVCARIEALCELRSLEVVDVAALILSPSAPEILFRGQGERLINVVLGHRSRIYALLHALLPPVAGAPGDPYADLLEEAPDQCVRVLIVDEESITVLSYGTFITVRIDPARRAVA